MSITLNDQEVTRDCGNCKFDNPAKYAAQPDECIDCARDTGSVDRWEAIPALADVPNLALARVRAEVIELRESVKTARIGDFTHSNRHMAKLNTYDRVLALIDREAQK